MRQSITAQKTYYCHFIILRNLPDYGGRYLFREGLTRAGMANNPSEHGADADAEGQAMQPLARDAYKRRRTGVVGGEAHTEILGGKIGGRETRAE